MKTTIDNNQSIFVVERIGISTNNVFCNLSDIPKVLANLEPNDNFVIQRYWNFKLKRIGKKAITEMFKANQINFKIK